MIIGSLNLTDNKVPRFLNAKPFLSNALQNPLITTGITTGWLFLIICAVPFRPGAKGFVVPCGNVITQLWCKAWSIFCVSALSLSLDTSFPSARQVLLTVRVPQSLNNLVSQLAFMVSAAATMYTFVNGLSR